MSALQRSEPSPSSATANQAEAVLLEWTVHLLRSNMRRAWVVFGVMALAALMGFLLFRSVAFSLVGVTLIFSSSAEFLLPIRYRLTTRRACAAYGAARLEIPWENVRRVLGADGRNAVKLSPLTAESRLDAFRGVLLRFAPDGTPGNREETLQIINRCLEEARRHD